MIFYRRRRQAEAEAARRVEAAKVAQIEAPEVAQIEAPAPLPAPARRQR